MTILLRRSGSWVPLIGTSTPPADQGGTVPAALTGLTGTPASTSVSLLWNASVGATVYEIRVGGVLNKTVSATSATVTSLSSATQYTFSVTPVNDAGSGTAASVTVTTSAATGFPSASTTGYTGTLTSRTGFTATAGQTIANQKITGPIRVGVDGVTIRNCWIVSSDYFPIDAEGATNLLVEDCTIEGASNSNACVLDSSTASGNVYRRLNISGSQDGIKLSSGSTLIDSYIHDLAPYDPVGDTHNDGVQFGVADGITVDHNTIVMGPGATSAILMGGGESRVRAINCLIQNNYLSGGGYTFYGPAPVSGNVTGGASQNVQVLNNTFTANWGYGSNTQWEAGIGNVWSGNQTNDGTTVDPAA